MNDSTGNDDPVFGFSTKQWIEPPEFDPKPPETTKDRYNRLHSETDFRNAHTPTAWYRYFTLGQYAVTGDLFEMMWREAETDPIRVHSVIWYNYMYHIERKKVIPDKLNAWATKISQQFLATHDPSLLTIDTLKTTWHSLATTKGFSMTPWKKVGPAKGRHNPAHKPTKSMNLQSLGFTRSRKASLFAPSQNTILEKETNPDIPNDSPIDSEKQVKFDTAPTANKTQDSDGLSTGSSDGKVSAIIPNTNVPVNDGTYRVTIRWSTRIDTSSTSRQTEALTNSIYSLLNDLFSDDDGLLYHWGTEGLEKYNSISKMTPQEVRSFISPSITLMPTQSMVIIPIRFGFNSKTPSAWRNLETTKATLDSYWRPGSIQEAGFPFTQREARFRDSVGPPSVIHVNPKLTANLNFLAKLSESKELTDTPQDTALGSSTSVISDQQDSVNSDVSTDSQDPDRKQDDGGMHKRPPTPLESLRNQYRNQSTGDNATVSTTSNSMSGKSRQSMLSTSSARFLELEARITRQQNDFDRKDKISSERLSQIERQLHRFDEVDSKLDSMKTDIDTKLETAQQAQTAELQTMSGQMLVVMEKQAGFGASINILSDKISLLMGLVAETTLPQREDATKARRPSPNASSSTKPSDVARVTEAHASIPAASIPEKEDDEEIDSVKAIEDGSGSLRSMESKSTKSSDSGKFRSPDKKKQKPVRGDKERIEVLLDGAEDDMNVDDDNQSQGKSQDEEDHHSVPMTTQNLEDITTDLESRYNTQNSLGGGSPS
ncbi:hypothetical protein MHU86_12737 [Fragilaria crotonensis]|nr:hypothetical protein MHU86_12737 [Fragilaria crotonensis]